MQDWFAIGSSTRFDPQEAAAQAAQEAEAALARAGSALPIEGAFVLATTAYGPAGLGRLFESLEDALAVPTVGAGVHGVLAPGLEVSGNPAVVVVLLAGRSFEPFQLAPADIGEAAAQLPATKPGDLAVVLPDAAEGAGRLVPALADALSPARVVGVATSEVIRGHGLTWCHGDLLEGACAGFVLRPAGPLRIGVAQACRLVNGVHQVSRARGGWVSGISGEPAIDLYRASGGLLGDDVEALAPRLLVGIGPPGEPAVVLGAGGLKVRRPVGFDRRRRAIGLPGEVEPGSAIAFAIQDPAFARDELRGLLEAAAGKAPATGLALYFSCTSRGAALFEHPGMEAGLLEAGLGGAVFAGAQGAFQVGPLVARDRLTPLAHFETEVLTRAGVLAFAP